MRHEVRERANLQPNLILPVLSGNSSPSPLLLPPPNCMHASAAFSSSVSLKESLTRS